MNKSPLRFTFLFLGKTKKSYLSEAVNDFQNRLSRFASVVLKTLKEKSYSTKVPKSKVLEEEGSQFLSHVGPDEIVVALDCTGRQCSSEELSCILADWQNLGKHKITFIIGGAHGLSKSVIKQSDVVLSLSKMTFTHEMARFILLEQLYRSFTILSRTGYHK